MYCINVCVKFNVFFPNSDRKKKPTHAPIVKKIHIKRVFGFTPNPCCYWYLFLGSYRHLTISPGFNRTQTIHDHAGVMASNPVEVN